MLPLNQVRIEMSYLSHSEDIERTPLLDYCHFFSVLLPKKHFAQISFDSSILAMRLAIIRTSVETEQTKFNLD